MPILASAWGAFTDRGLVRERNEDAVVAGPAIIAVADGMGGHQRGDVASSIVAHALAGLADTCETARDVVDALAAANARMRRYAQTTLRAHGVVGTTVSGVAFPFDLAGSAVVFNVGDSRVYRWRDDEMLQLSRDHSLVQELVDMGEIDRDHAAHHPSRHVVTRALGTGRTSHPDLFVVELMPGDRFLACSDGLTDVVPHGLIRGTLGDATSPCAAAQALVDLAISYGAPDNVSAVVRWVPNRKRYGGAGG